MEFFGFVGFALATFAYCISLFLIFVTKQKSFTSKLLLSLVCILALAYLACALQMHMGFSLLAIFAVEFVKLMLLILVIFSLRFQSPSFIALVKQRKVNRFLCVWLLAALASLYSILYLSNYSVVFLSLMSLNLYPIVLLEQLYRNGNDKVRWSLWPLLVAFGCLLVFDFIMYAQGALLNQLDFNFWFSRGYIGFITAPFFLLGSKRIKNLTADLFISREVVFYSSMLAIAGSYLLLLSFAGYIIRFIEGEWSEVLSVLFLAIGSLFLVVLFITNSFRRRVKVFISKHFFANKYEYRDEWLKVTKGLEHCHKGDVIANLCEVMANSVGVNKCAFIKVSAHSLTIEHSIELSIQKEQLEELQKISDYCAVQQWIVDVREYEDLIDRYQGLDLSTEPLKKANLDLCIPVYRQDKLFGLFILPAPTGRSHINWEDRDYFFAVAKQLANYLFLQQAQQQLSQSEQFAMFNRMSAFVLHDLKNIEAQLALINTNAQKHRNNPEFVDDVFETVETASKRLNKVTMQLRNKGHELKQQKVELIDIPKFLQQVIRQFDHSKPIVTLESTGDGEIIANKEQFNNVLIHLIQNAQQACAQVKSKTVHVVFSENLQYLMITVTDTGCGMSEDFIKRKLFKPFVTTKGNAGMGIGAYEAKQFAEQNHGTLTVKSKVDTGSTFTLSLPKIIKEASN